MRLNTPERKRNGKNRFELSTNQPNGNDGPTSGEAKKLVKGEAAETKDNQGNPTREQWSIGRGVTADDLQAMNTPLNRDDKG